MPSVTQDTDTAHVAFFLTVLKLRQRKSPVAGWGNGAKDRGNAGDDLSRMTALYLPLEVIC
jgi:hypothetical protein